MQTKAWYTSKTVWFSVLYIIVGLAEVFGYTDFVPTTNVAELLTVLGMVVQLILRVRFTDKGLRR